MSLILIQSQTKCWAITMRKTKNPLSVNEKTYVTQMNYFKSCLGCVFEVIKFENTSGLHMHGIVRVPVTTSMTRFRVRGWSIRLEELYDPQGWIDYINKDQVDEDLTLTPEDERFDIPKIKLFGNI